jgi:fructose transport system substrate-binding protein
VTSTQPRTATSIRASRTGSSARWRRLVVVAVTAALAIGAAACDPADEDPITIGLITKQETNPYWITLREVAEDTARDEGVDLLTATGQSDTDVASQQAALEDMTRRGVDGILIAVNDSTALVPAIEDARAAGITVIAVDTPVEPEGAVDALFATDNVRAGELIGRWAVARAQELGVEPRVAMLDLAPGISSGEQRREGFLRGAGLEPDGPQIAGSADTEGDEALAREALERMLATDPAINIVYAVNEPAAFGAVAAIEDADLDGDVVVVTVDGGCDAVMQWLRPGRIGATAQQYPENMAREGVRALAQAARGGERPSGYLDTGVALITADPVEGVASRDVAFGVRNCWG